MSNKSVTITNPEFLVTPVYAAPTENSESDVTHFISQSYQSKIKIIRTATFNNAVVTTHVELETTQLTFEQLKDEALKIVDKYEMDNK